MNRALQALALLALGCAPTVDPGECDQDGALALVYTPEGSPAFAGQAMVIRDCGGGGFCHSGSASGANRFGAPAGLDYDLRPASSGAELEAEAVARLGADQRRILDEVHRLWGEVSSGRMPVGGADGAVVRENVDVGFEHPGADGRTFSPLPAIDSAEGEAIFRNWLACGAPVVERTVPRLDGRDNDVGFTAPSCARRCVEPSWPAIYTAIVAAPEPSGEHWTGGSCAGSRCHSSAEAAGALVLDQGPELAWTALVGAAPAGDECMGVSAPLIAPGDPEGSLLWQKLGSEPECGERMPLSGDDLTVGERCALREWIRCGACADPDDPACASCIDEASVACGFDAAGPGGCAEPSPCSPTLPG